MSKFLYILLTIFMVSEQGFSNNAQEPAQSFELPQRSQEPRLPYPYAAEEVSFTNTQDGVILAGTLTLPRSQGPCPAVILLHGSAPFDRDSSLFGHKPFLVWADHLTKQGIAVLRFDKRSAGKSTGDYSTANLEDFANDALAAVEYLKTRKEINNKQIGLIGHSEGGMTATLASTKSDDIAFVVLMAAPCVNWEELAHTQEANFQRVDGVAEEIIDKNRKVKEQVFAILKKEKNLPVAEKQLRELFTKYLSKLSLAERMIAERYYGPMEAQINFWNSVWYRYNFAYNPALALKRVKIPVLALNGELDWVVSSEQNLTQISKTLQEIKHKDYTVMTLPKLNHMFQTCQTGSVSECAQIDETTSPVALNAISEWILQKTVLKR